MLRYDMKEEDQRVIPAIESMRILRACRPMSSRERRLSVMRADGSSIFSVDGAPEVACRRQ